MFFWPRSAGGIAATETGAWAFQREMTGLLRLDLVLDPEKDSVGTGVALR